MLLMRPLSMKCQQNLVKPPPLIATIPGSESELQAMHVGGPYHPDDPSFGQQIGVKLVGEVVILGGQLRIDLLGAIANPVGLVAGEGLRVGADWSLSSEKSDELLVRSSQGKEDSKSPCESVTRVVTADDW